MTQKPKMNARTGHYATKIIDICPKKDTTLPPITLFQEFFSQFGPILTVYHHDNSQRATKPDHTFVVFENEYAVANVKKYWAQQNKSDFWKKSYNFGSHITKCPAAMMSQIKSLTGEISGPFAKPSQADQSASSSMSKRVADLAPEPNKRTRTACDDAGSSFQAALLSSAFPPQSSENVNASQETPHFPSVPLRMFGFRQPSTYHDNRASAPIPELDEANELINNPPSINVTVSALEEEAEKLRVEFEEMKARRDQVKSERDQLLVERDEARAEGQKLRMEREEARVEIERYRTERDKVIEQYEAEAEKCRELRTRIEGLEKTVKGKDETSRQVLKLMITSLQTGSAADQPGSSLGA